MTIQEIALKWNDQEQEADFDFENGDLSLEQTLMSSIIISLFTDGRAKDDDELPDILNGDKRGWWGDLASPEFDNDQIGSRLWLLERSKTIPENLVRAKEYIKECLNWMIEDGIANEIEVETEKQFRNETYFLAFKVIPHLIEGFMNGSNLSVTFAFATGSSGANIRGIDVISMDEIDSLTFDGVDELIF